jgi:hypothetical protein
MFLKTLWNKCISLNLKGIGYCISHVPFFILYFKISNGIFAAVTKDIKNIKTSNNSNDKIDDYNGLTCYLQYIYNPDF